MSSTQNPISTAEPPPSGPSSLTRSAKLTLAILTVAACGMACLLALLPAAGHDQMWLLYAAQLMLHGAPLYGPQIFETNPPLIIWLSAIPAGLSILTHVSDTALGKFLVLALEFVIARFCLRLLPSETNFSAEEVRADTKPFVIWERTLRPIPSSPTLLFLLFTYITVVAVLPARDFGQRDHLLALFLLPYLCAAARRAQGQTLPAPFAFLIGVLALFGLILKPHQLLVPIAVESYLLLQKPRSARNLLRPETLAMLLTGLAFIAATRLFAPLYFSTIVPIERDTYWAYGGLTLPQLFGESIQLHILLALTVAITLKTGWRKTSPLVRILLLAGLAATLAFYLQGTGWYYQQLPALTFLAFALTLFLVDLIPPFAAHRNITFPGWLVPASAALSILALALTTHFMNYPFTNARAFPIDQPDPAFFAALPPGAAVLTLSPTVDDTIQPIYKFHLTLAERYPALLMLPAILRSESGPAPRHRLTLARVNELDRLQYTFMVEDLTRWHPALILVERCQDPAVHCQVLEDRHDDLLTFFLRDPAFAAIFAHYHLTRTSGPYDAYTLN